MNSIKSLNEEFNESKKTIQSLIETSGNIIGKETITDSLKSKMGDNITINLFENDAVFLKSKLKADVLNSESDINFKQKNLETLKTNKIAFGGDDEDDDNLSK